ncbi:Rv2175c family DNA-binding protein [Frankia sp. Cppng1_Ct_nod]|uniref:Rv2175c family DNA-binding protein n=1 Tax=Frankia sp. Cppng1_Ct_nod TaxID=2897162 RepID=UPI0032EA6EFD
MSVDWLTLPDVADRLGVPITRVRQMVRDRKLLAVRSDGVLRVPVEFVQDGEIVKGLPGLLTVLADAGFTDEESMEWLFREDPTLPGTPARALAENRGREVKRRAQALAF